MKLMSPLRSSQATCIFDKFVGFRIEPHVFFEVMFRNMFPEHVFPPQLAVQLLESMFQIACQADSLFDKQMTKVQLNRKDYPCSGL
jgi:hypothetical protein